MGAQSNRAKMIFLEAIEQHAPEQWPTVLEQACAGDRALRAEVEKLLEAQAALGSFHESPLPTLLPRSDGPVAEGPGTRIGPYTLLEQIGEGAFGLVFLAEQQRPVRRRVALKILKPGMDTRQVLARFEVERQALALMDHTNIARVLDAGATDSGRPFVVMELVQGVPITEYCDEHRLTLAARLRLFLDVCQALQHAHHKGVIHRDIKPANVLVTRHDGAAVVKVIDFGIAKALRQKLTARTLFTGHGQMIGTPAYMSPEQAQSGGQDLDTRSDVYGLGVLLYELLTGTTPLEGARLSGAGYVELQRLVREEPAPRPSTRLAALGEAAAAAATRRGLDTKRLARLLAGDLDWVVLKALEKDRERRYDTPASFAADLGRYLRREAVLARPPSALYQLRKFVRRHRTAVLTGCAVAAALLAGAALATWQAVVATQAQQKAVAAATAEKRAKEQAQAREAETAAVLDFVENYLLAFARPLGQDGGLGPDGTLRRAVEAALPFIEKRFAHQPLVQARLRLTLARTFTYLGDAKKAAAQNEAARAIYLAHLGPDHPDTLRSMYYLAINYAELGRHAEALQLRLVTLQKRQAVLGADHPDTLRSMTGLANSYAALGRHAEALQLRQETLALQQRKLGTDHPDTLISMYNLAASYADLGKHTEALQLRRETLALHQVKLGPDHPETLRSKNALAVSQAALGRHAEAVKLYEETLELMKARLGADHPDVFAALHNLALSYAALGRHAEALQLHQETLALLRLRFGPDHPLTLQSATGLASTYAELGRHAEAAKLRKKTLQVLWAKLGPDHPDTLLGMYNLAVSCAALGRHTDAVKLYDKALAPMKVKLGADHPDTLRSMHGLAVSYAALGRHGDAVVLYEQTLALQQARLGTDHPDTLWTMHNLAISYAGLGRHGKAFELRRRTLTLRKARLGPDHPDTLRSLCGLALSCAALGRHAEAVKLHEEALAQMQVKLGADHRDTLRAMDNLAISYAALGRQADALRLRQEALALLQAKLGADHPDTLRGLWGVAASLVALGRGAEAVPLIDACLERAAGAAVPPGLLPGVVDLRLWHFASVKDAAGCRQTAALWESLKRTDADSLYRAACLRAVTAAVLRGTEGPFVFQAAQADVEADWAMAWLKQAVAAGYKNAVQLKQDRALDALRGRADFARLVTLLESARD
jgi:serine/threonine protein kinase/tetratricopeptide (TPR) repeat protein